MPVTESTPPLPAYPLLEKLPALDGARGLAVLLVLGDHASDAGMRLFPGADLNRAGKYGVYLFFVLSAFLLTLQLSMKPREDLIQVRTWMAYALRRFLRIFPPYAVALGAYVLMRKLELMDLVQHLALREGVRHFWTIPVEVKYYVLLPALAVSLFWGWRRHWLLGVGCLICTCALAIGLSIIDRRWALREAVLLAPNLAPFLIGSALAIIYSALLRNTAARARFAPWLEAAAFIAAATLAMRLPAINDLFFTSKPLLGKEFDPAVCGALWSVFLLGVLHGTGLLAACLKWNVLRYIGLISFSMYLWHGKFLNDVDDLPAPSPVRLLVYVAVVAAVATVAYLLVERPLARLRLRASANEPVKNPAI